MWEKRVKFNGFALCGCMVACFPFNGPPSILCQLQSIVLELRLRALGSALAGHESRIDSLISELSPLGGTVKCTIH